MAITIHNIIYRSGSCDAVRSVLGEIHLTHGVEMQMISCLQSYCSELIKFLLIVSSSVYPSSIALLLTVKGRGFTTHDVINV